MGTRNVGFRQWLGQPMEIFGTIGGTVDYGLWGISGTGSTVAGSHFIDSISPTVGFYATSPTTMQPLALLATYRSSIPQAVNHDGSVVVGYASLAGSLSRRQAFRWTPEGGIQGLGYLRTNSPFQSRALAVSADGNTIAGVAIPEYNTGLSETFVWRPQTGMQLLPAPQGSATEAGLEVTGMSKNGNCIVGNWSADRRLRRGVLWSNGTPMDLGDLAPNSTVLPKAVSADGQVVAGTTGFNGQQAPFIWSPDSGLRLLTSVLSENGVAPTPGVQLLACDAMTPDGKTFAGTCTYNGQTMGYVVSIPAPGIGAWLMVAGVVAQRRRR